MLPFQLAAWVKLELKEQGAGLPAEIEPAAGTSAGIALAAG